MTRDRHLKERIRELLDYLRNKYRKCKFELLSLEDYISLKLEIYPAGIYCFCGLSIREIEEQIEKVIQRMYEEKRPCPYCGRELSVFDVLLTRNCSCGAEFREPVFYYFGRFPSDDVEEEILNKLGNRLEFFIQLGFSLKEVVEGVKPFRIFGKKIYAFRGDLSLLPEEKIFNLNEEAKVKRLLLSRDFSCLGVDIYWNTLWEGKVNGEKQKVFVLKHEPERGVFIDCSKLLRVFQVDVEEIKSKCPDCLYEFRMYYEMSDYYVGWFFPYEEILRSGIEKSMEKAKEGVENKLKTLADC